MAKLYPESSVEVAGWEARFYDTLMNVITLGSYGRFIEDVVRSMEIAPGDRIVDFGHGTGRNACLMRHYLGDSGQIDGLDVGEEMRRQFEQNCSLFANVRSYGQRIDGDLPLTKSSYDKVAISFVLHGIPPENRGAVIQNAYDLLKSGGKFFVLDYAEKKMKEIPFFVRIPFQLAECPYAFEYMEQHNWREELAEYGFSSFAERFYFFGMVRLLTAEA